MSRDRPDRNGDTDPGAEENGTDERDAQSPDRADDPGESGGEPPGSAALTAASDASRAGAGSMDRPSSGAARLTTDRLFELLASPGNRFVLTYLLRVDGPVEYADLVEYVVARAGPPAEMTEAKFRGRVAATLLDETIPALSDAGLVEVDSSEQLVAPTPTTSLAAPYLALALSELVAPHDD